MSTTPLHLVCPACYCEHDAATGANTDEAPAPGDITVCIRCGTVCQFGAEMQMIEVDPDDVELAAIAFRIHQAWLRAQLEDACDACRMNYWIERAFTRCCHHCQRHVVPHRGCLVRGAS